MIRKITLLLVLGFFTIGNLLSQTDGTIDWGKAKELPKNIRYKKVIGYDANGIYILKENKYNHNQLWLEHIGRQTMTIDQTNELILPSYSGIQPKYADMFYINKKLILLSTALNTDSNKEYLLIQYMNPNGTVKNEPQLIGSIPIPKTSKDNFKWRLTNKNQLCVLYNKPFSVYNQEPFSFKVYDTDLKEVNSYNFSLSSNFNNRQFEITQTEINSTKGKIVMLLKALSISKKKTSAQQYDIFIVVYDMHKKAMNYVKIALKKGKPINGIFTFNKEGNIIVGGFYEPKTNKISGSFAGAYYRIINPNTCKVIPSGEPKYYFMPFTKDFIANLNSPRNGETAKQRFSYKLRSIETMANGSFMIIAEQQYITVRTITDPKTKQNKGIKYYNYGDLLIAGVNKNQKFAWVKKIYKKQLSIDDNGYYSSYKLVKIRNKVRIIYNDIIANMAIDENKLDKLKTLRNNLNAVGRGIAVVSTVFYDGTTIKDPLFTQEKDNTIVPSLIIPIDKQYFTFLQQKKIYQFRLFKLE